ncbi:GNAT family N-acetyltransferase [Nocardioides cavernae]|uniref:GNAT family N-acetyltransferase n=1 Tax=Nocardioides TaxID=1839 RepID=UPI0009EA614D|nr:MULTISPECIES: GNAT family N-acetyltransferase [Nocardioides]MCK9823696.1 GNAT family N-acetyltransferase [Nocardioides cavernae]
MTHPPTHHVHVHVRLRDGGSALLRPLAGGEVSVVEAVFEGLSSQSRRRRFLVPMPRLPGGHRRTLADVDGDRHVAWVALVHGIPVGLCRFVRTSADSAELAFEVVDEHQGRGIGSALVDAVTTVARDRGITWLEATVEPGNAASEALLARAGVRLVAADGLLEGRGTPRAVRWSSPVNPRAVLALAAQPASSSSTAAATSSSWRSEPCLATS